MKPYQHHDPVLDKGKAVPAPKLPTSYTYRGKRTFGALNVDRVEFLRMRKRGMRKGPDKKLHQALTVFATIAACLGLRRGKSRS